jgi:hypothetical protein
MHNRNMAIGAIMLLSLVLLATAAHASSGVEFRHKPIGPFSITQGETFTYDFNATNTTSGLQIVEDGTVIGYTTDDLVGKVAVESVFVLNKITGQLSYTPHNKDSTKDINILFLLADPTLQATVFESLFVKFIVDNVNDPPVIVNQSPYTIETNASENSALVFTVNATDPDFYHGSDNLTVEWIFNNVTMETEDELSSDAAPYIVTSEYEAEFGFCDAGLVNITALVSDIEGLQDMFSWEVNVSNVNRPIEFDGEIPNATWNEGVSAQNHTPIWSLYDFFIDLDHIECTGEAQELLSFEFEGLENITAYVNETTGEITFESPPFWRGEENITITAFDYDSNATSNTFWLIVNSSGYPPNITEIGDQNAATGAPFILYIRVEDPDLLFGDNITYYDNSTLFSIQWHNITGNVSYGKIEFTPMPGDEGEHTILIEVEDLYGNSDNATFRITILENSPPVLSPIGDKDATQDALFSLTLSGFDADDHYLTFYTNSSIFGLPFDAIRGYTLNSMNATHSYVSFTPTNEQVGSYTIRFYVYDVLGALDTETITFEIINVNDPPTLTQPLPADLYAKTNQTFTFYVNATDPDIMHGDILTYASNDSIVNLTKLTDEQAIMQFTPEDSDEGIRRVKVNVTDIEGLYDEWIFNLHILPPTPPVLDPIINLTATENEPFISFISATDANQDPLVFTINDTIWSNHMQVLDDNSIIINATYVKAHVGTYSINVTVTDVDGLSDSIIVIFEVEETDNPPEIEHPGNLIFYEGIMNIVILNVTDLEGDNWTITTNASDLLNITQINITNANMTSTPNISQIGNHTVLLTVTQVSNPTLFTSIEVNITITHNPSHPVIESFEPDPPNYIVVYEGSSRLFNATITDPDFAIEENITAEWYYNGVLMKTEYVESDNVSIYYNFTPGYCAHEESNGGDDAIVELLLTDQYGLTTSMEWDLYIANVNRPPEYGVRRFKAEYLASGTLDGLEYEDGALILATPLSSGTLTSSVIDFGSSFGKDLVNVTYGSIEASGHNLSSANIMYSIRTSSVSNTIHWTMPWTDYQALGSDISLPPNTTPKRYAQIRLRINDSEGHYPAIEEIEWHFSLGDQTLEASSAYSNWISLADFFFDPDDECGVNTRIPGNNSNIITEVEIDDSDDMYVTLYTGPTPGVEEWWFTFSDGMDSVESNVIKFTTLESEIPPITIPIPTGGGGGGGTTTITTTIPIPVEVESPVPIDLIVPDSITIYDNDTMTVPITLVNTLNSSLLNIRLHAESENPNITFSFSQDSVLSIEAGSNHSLTMSMQSYRTYGNYEATIYAYVENPSFNASKKFFVNSIELGRHGDQEFNTRLSFVRDLLSTNPECIELSEQLDQARLAIQAGNVQRAAMILDSVSENCRYMISQARPEARIEQPTGFFSIIRNTPSQMLSYIGIIVVMNLLLAVMFAIFYSHPPRKGMPIVENKDEQH